MTFTLDAVAEPLNVPPRVALTATEDDSPNVSLQSVAFFRDGVPLRFESIVTGDAAIAYDYDAPFDVALSYRADGTEVGSPIEWTETWASLAAWTGSGWSVGAGVATSTGSASEIYRATTSTIIQVAVTSPSNLTLFVDDDGGFPFLSVLVSPDGTVTLSGTTTSKVTGSGSFTLSLGEVSATIAGSGWSTTVPYLGLGVRVRLVGPQTGTFMSRQATISPMDGRVGYPSDIAIDSGGNAWVADYENHQVLKYDPTGIYAGRIGSAPAGTADGEFDAPQGIGIDSSDNVWVVDTGNNRVQVFDSAGTFLFKFGTAGSGNGQFNAPTDVAFDSTGKPFVVDSNNHRVQKFTALGVYQAQFGTNGSADGEFIAPQGIAIGASDNMWVVDQGNARVQKFNSAGVYQSKFGTFGSDIGEFFTPQRIAIDGDANLWVTDFTNAWVQKYDSAGVFQSQFGSEGSGNGLFATPIGITIVGTTLWVADRDGRNYQKFWLGPGTTDDIAVRVDDGDGIIDVTASDTATITGVEGAWLTNAAIPDLAVLIDANADVTADYFIVRSTAEETELKTNSVALEIEGSPNTLTVATGPRKKETWVLAVAATSVAARRVLLAALANDAPVSIRFPSAGYDGLDAGFYAVGDLSTSRIGRPSHNPVTVVSLPLTPSRAPRFKPLWQWNMDALAQTGMTMDDVNAAYTSMTDLLIGPT